MRTSISPPSEEEDPHETRSCPVGDSDPSWHSIDSRLLRRSGIPFANPGTCGHKAERRIGTGSDAREAERRVRDRHPIGTVEGKLRPAKAVQPCEIVSGITEPGPVPRRLRRGSLAGPAVAVAARDEPSGSEENPAMKPFCLFVAVVALAGLSQGCQRMEPRRALMRRSPSDGVMVTPSSPSPMVAPSEGSGPIRGYRPSEGS
jgi:hypothetical protein